MKNSNNLKLVCGTIAGMMIGGLTVVGANQAIQAMQNTEIKVSLNGQVQTFKDETTGETQYPITYNNRTYLPLRNVANLAGLGVDYDNNTNTALLRKNCSINEIDVSKGGEHSKEYKEELVNKLANIKQSLVNSSMFKLSSAYDSNSKDDYLKYWGSSFHYGGGLEFFDDDTFLFSIGIWADSFERAGTYIIDMHNNKIIYRLANGTIVEGSFKLENDKVSEVTFVQTAEYLEDGPIYVTLRASTEDEVLSQKVLNSFSGQWKLEKATKGNQEYDLDNYKSWNSMFYDFEFPNNDKIEIDSTPGRTYGIDTKENKIVFNIIKKNSNQAPAPEELGNASDYFYYELGENKEIKRLIYVENENTANELKLSFIRGN